MIVHGKVVRIVESHDEALGDWADAARDTDSPLALVSLDRHTDTTPALMAEYRRIDDDGNDTEPSVEFWRWQRRVLARFRGAEADEIGALIERIENDEQIDAALRLGIFGRALIVSSQAGRTDAPTIEGAAIYRPICAAGCTNAAHEGSECARRRFDAILEPECLGRALEHLGHRPAAPYVLDIDLDAFSTRRGLRPADASVFHALIAGASLITLAREPEYVRESLDDHDADEIEAAVMTHIASAAATTTR